MLANLLNEFKSGIVYPDGYQHDRGCDPVRRRIASSQVFVLDRDASAMAASVALSRPTTILATLPWVRLPFDQMWIEFLNADLRDAMGSMGSPNVPTPNARSILEMSGFLLMMDGDDLVIDYVHADRTPQDGRRLIDISPVRGRFAIRGDNSPPNLPFSLFRVHEKAQGRLRRHQSEMAENPEEYAAEVKLKSMFRWEPHPDVARIRGHLVSMIGEVGVMRMEAEQGDEMCRLFLLQVLPALILLNCRNAVETERVGVSPKLNRNRAAKGKPPLVEHLIVRMRLSPRMRRKGETRRTGDSRAPRGTMVMGHFKVRKSGIFWWSPHARLGYGAVTRTTILTR